MLRSWVDWKCRPSGRRRISASSRSTASFWESLEKSSISVRADIDEELPELRGDRLQLQQLVFNLLRDGIDAMKDVHGQLRRLEISCRADDVEMLAAFRDCVG